jgi:urease accessory protein
MIRSFLRLFAVAMAFLPIAASAHVGVGDTHGLLHGFSHPFSGIDHTLAMVAVGIIAARLGGRALWSLPLTFVSVMGLAGIKLAFVEISTGMSVVVFGLAIAFQRSRADTSCHVSRRIFCNLPRLRSRRRNAGKRVWACVWRGLHSRHCTASRNRYSLGVAVGKAGQLDSRRIVQIGGGAMATASIAILFF